MTNKREDRPTVTHTADVPGAPESAESPGGSTGGPAPVFPPGRYGRRREPATRRRWLVPVAATIMIAICAVFAVKLYKQYGISGFTPTVVSVSHISDTSMTVRFNVQKPAGKPVICTLNAVAYDGTVVGTAQVPVPAGKDVTLSYTVTTLSRAYVADVPTCQPAG